jgi:hypothetical protein
MKLMTTSREFIGEGRARGIGGFDAALVVLIATALLLLAGPAWRVFYVVPWDYNEGWNAYHAARAVGEGPLYPAANSYLTNNYPPLSFLIVGTIGRLISDNILAGRIIAFVSVLTVAACIGVIVQALTRSWRSAVFAGALFAGVLAAQHPLYVAMDDPEMLGHAVMMTGFAWFIRSLDHRPAIVAVACIIAIAGFIKHNLLPVPIAITLFFAAHNRQLFLRWCLAAGAVLTAALALTYGIYGNAFFQNLLAGRHFDLANGVVWLAIAELSYLQVLIVFAVMGFALMKFRSAHRLIGMYAAAAGVTGILFAGGAGVDVNIFFDLVIALAIAAGIFIRPAIDMVERGIAATDPERNRMGMVPLMLPLVLASAMFIAAPRNLIQLTLPLHALEQETREDLELIRSQAGSVWCETLALCYWAGKPAEIDTFNTQQAMLTGRLDEADLVRRIVTCSFAAIQLERANFRLEPAIQDAIRHHYSVVRESHNGNFLRPADCAGE